MNKRARTVRDMRIAAGLNQTVTAQESGYTRQEFSFIESGRLLLSTDTYDAIEKAIVRLVERRAHQVLQMVSIAGREGNRATA